MRHKDELLQKMTTPCAGNILMKGNNARRILSVPETDRTVVAVALWIYKREVPG
jgi:hypothetical protein